MTGSHVESILSMATAKKGKDGWHVLPEGLTLTLYASRGGSGPLTIPKVTSLRADSELVAARTHKGDTFFVTLEDIMALSLDGSVSDKTGRRAGF